MIEVPGYQIVSDIGRGAFATVYLGHPTDNPTRKLAIKVVRTAGLTRKLAEALAAEVAILRSIGPHPNIVRLEAIETDKQRHVLFLVMEFMEGGDVAALMRDQRGGLPEPQVKSYIGQLVSALSCLQRANLVHRDIKPQNLLLTHDKATLKLADFGFARYVEEQDLAETLCGSPLYMAPEILRCERYDDRADLWSVGAVMYEMLTGRPPFRAQNHIQLLKVIERADGHLDMPVGVSESAQDLLRGLLQSNPRDRITFDQVVHHPFLLQSSTDNSSGRGTIDDMSSSLFEVRPIPINKSQAKRSSLSSSLSSSPSLISNALLSRRRSTPSIPSSLGYTLQQHQQPPSNTATTSSAMALSSREQWSLEDERVIGMLPEKCQKLARRGQVLYELLPKVSTRQQQQVCKMSFAAFLSTHALLVENEEEHEAMPWLMTRLKDLVADIDFEDPASSTSEDDMPIACLLYDAAMRSAVEGGFQELVGRVPISKMHYERSLFIIDEFNLHKCPLVSDLLLDIGKRLEAVQAKMSV